MLLLTPRAVPFRVRLPAVPESEPSVPKGLGGGWEGIRGGVGTVQRC